MRVGGAQAIAALAYGTKAQLIKLIKLQVQVMSTLQKLRGKFLVTVGIDSVAGPSEVLLICDKTMPD